MIHRMVLNYVCLIGMVCAVGCSEDDAYLAHMEKTSNKLMRDCLENGLEIFRDSLVELDEILISDNYVLTKVQVIDIEKNSLRGVATRMDDTIIFIDEIKKNLIILQNIENDPIKCNVKGIDLPGIMWKFVEGYNDGYGIMSNNTIHLYDVDLHLKTKLNNFFMADQAVYDDGIIWLVGGRGYDEDGNIILSRHDIKSGYLLNVTSLDELLGNSELYGCLPLFMSVRGDNISILGTWTNKILAVNKMTNTISINRVYGLDKISVEYNKALMASIDRMDITRWLFLTPIHSDFIETYSYAPISEYMDRKYIVTIQGGKETYYELVWEGKVIGGKRYEYSCLYTQLTKGSSDPVYQEIVRKDETGEYLLLTYNLNGGR